MSLGSSGSRGLKRRHSECENASPTVVPSHKIAMHPGPSGVSHPFDVRRIINKALDVSERSHSETIKNLREALTKKEFQRSKTAVEFQELGEDLQRAREELQQRREDDERVSV